MNATMNAAQGSLNERIINSPVFRFYFVAVKEIELFIGWPSGPTTRQAKL